MVYKVSADIRNPFDADVDKIPAKWVLNNGGDPEQMLSYNEVADELPEGKEYINQVLREHGYDGITHIGGVVSGGKKHRVWIAFATEQVKMAGAPLFPPGAVGDLGGTPMPHGSPLAQLYDKEYAPLFSAIERDLNRQAATPQVKDYNNLPPNVREGLMAWGKGVEDSMAESKLAALRWAEYRRDTAILNYSRRYQWDNYLGAIAPYQFWMTHSAINWVAHSVKRAGALANAARANKYWVDTQRRPGFPSRLFSKIKVPLPFMPDWMGGGIWIDPSRLGNPMSTFTDPWQNYFDRQSKLEQKIQQQLDDWVDGGKIPEGQREQARAEAEKAVLADDKALRYDAADMFTSILSPSMPLMWAYQAMRGTPERIAPLPPTRWTKAITSALGVGPVGGVNLEGAVRTQLGLPVYDQWDDYRIDRELANMAGDGFITASQARAAMIEREGSVYDEAMRRAQTETNYSMLAGLLTGGPAGLFPTGEAHQRMLALLSRGAYDAREKGDTTALSEFYMKYPEYAARLALFNDPDERLNKFLVEQVWQGWNALPDLYQKEVREALGPEFQEGFLNQETADTKSLPPDMLAGWARTLGRYVPANVEGDALNVEYAPAWVAEQAQEYYALRDQHLTAEVRALQSAYFAIPDTQKANRRGLLAAAGDTGKALKAWWDMKNAWMDAHPDVKAATAVPEGTVFQENIPTEEQRLIGMYLFDGRPLTPALRKKLETAWEAQGKPADFRAWLIDVLAWNESIEPTNPAWASPEAQR